MTKAPVGSTRNEPALAVVILIGVAPHRAFAREIEAGRAETPGGLALRESGPVAFTMGRARYFPPGIWTPAGSMFLLCPHGEWQVEQAWKGRLRGLSIQRAAGSDLREFFGVPLDLCPGAISETIARNPRAPR